MRNFIIIALSATALSACVTQVQDVAPVERVEPIEQVEAHPYLGVYAGTYTCALGENGITVSLDRAEENTGAAVLGQYFADARLWFYDTAGNAGHPSGAFNLSGILRGITLKVSPTEWISDVPRNWGAAGISAEFFEEDGDVFLVGRPTGNGTEACEPFRLKRLQGF